VISTQFDVRRDNRITQSRLFPSFETSIFLLSGDESADLCVGKWHQKAPAVAHSVIAFTQRNFKPRP
jgi:hypothetical protein